MYLKPDLFTYYMYKANGLVKLCERLFARLPPDEQIMDRYHEQDYKPIDLEKNVKLVARLYLDCALSGRGIRSVQDEMGSSRFYFKYESNGQLGAYRKTEKKKPAKYHLYDKVVMFGGGAVIFKLTFAKWKSAKSRYSKEGRRRVFRTSAITSMRKDVYMRSVVPIRELWGKAPGYIIIVPQDVYETSKISTSPIKQEYFSHGGILLPFPMKRLEFRDHVSKMIARYVQ